jgi:hypothetical protein
MSAPSTRSNHALSNSGRSIGYGPSWTPVSDSVKQVVPVQHLVDSGHPSPLRASGCGQVARTGVPRPASPPVPSHAAPGQVVAQCNCRPVVRLSRSVRRSQAHRDDALRRCVTWIVRTGPSPQWTWQLQAGTPPCSSTVAALTRMAQWINCGEPVPPSLSYALQVLPGPAHCQGRSRSSTSRPGTWPHPESRSRGPGQPSPASALAVWTCVGWKARMDADSRSGVRVRGQPGPGTRMNGSD